MSLYNSTQRPLNECSTEENRIEENRREENKLSLNESSRVERVFFENLSSFKSHFIQKNSGILFYTKGLGYLPDTPFVVENELIKNKVNNKILNKEDAYKIWDYLFNSHKNQNISA